MGRTTTTLLAITGLCLVGAGAARRAQQQVLAGTDRFTVDELRRDVTGDVTHVERPDGTRVRTVVAGPADGPTVVLSHGYAASTVEWNVLQEELLRRGWRTVALDWRGHGGTNIGSEGATPEAIAGDLVAVLTHHDVRDAVFMGHSTGGYLAIAAAILEPEFSRRLRGLALVASLAGDVTSENRQNALQVPLIKSGVMARIARSATLGPLFGASIWGPDPSPAAIEVFLEMFLETDHQQLVPLLQRLTDRGWYDRLDEITLPTVVVCGEEDHTTPRWHSEALGRDIPDARNEWVPAAGHMLNWQSPDVLLRVIEELGATGAPV